MSNRAWLTVLMLFSLVLLWLAVIAGSDAQQASAALGACVFVAGRLVMDELKLRRTTHIHLTTIIGHEGVPTTVERLLTEEELVALQAGAALFQKLASEARAAEQPAPGADHG